VYDTAFPVGKNLRSPVRRRVVDASRSFISLICSLCNVESRIRVRLQRSFQ